MLLLLMPNSASLRIQIYAVLIFFFPFLFFFFNAAAHFAGPIYRFPSDKQFFFMFGAKCHHFTAHLQPAIALPQEINRLDASCTQKGVNIPLSAAIQLPAWPKLIWQTQTEMWILLAKAELLKMAVLFGNISWWRLHWEKRNVNAARWRIKQTALTLNRWAQLRIKEKRGCHLTAAVIWGG